MKNRIEYIRAILLNVRDEAQEFTKSTLISSPVFANGVTTFTAESVEGFSAGDLIYFDDKTSNSIFANILSIDIDNKKILFTGDYHSIASGTELIKTDALFYLDNAIFTFSKFRPLLIGVTVTGDGTSKYDLPDKWMDNFSNISMIEKPIGNIPPEVYPISLHKILTDENGVPYLQFAEEFSESDSFKIFYTTLHYWLTTGGNNYPLEKSIVNVSSIIYHEGEEDETICAVIDIGENLFDINDNISLSDITDFENDPDGEYTIFQKGENGELLIEFDLGTGEYEGNGVLSYNVRFDGTQKLTVSESDYLCVCDIASAYYLLGLAALYGQSTKGTISADNVNYQNKTDSYRRLAKEYLGKAATWLGVSLANIQEGQIKAGPCSSNQDASSKMYDRREFLKPFVISSINYLSN